MPNQPNRERQSARHDVYVLRLPAGIDRSDVRQRVEKFGTVEDVPGYSNLLLLNLESSLAKNAKDAWKALNDKLGEIAEVNPVIEADDGTTKYALGSVIVRFPEAPSDEQLEQWAQDHKLVVEKRNKYAPQQVSFRPEEHAQQFLPDVVHSLSKETGVRCWLDTLSAYRR